MIQNKINRLAQSDVLFVPIKSVIRNDSIIDYATFESIIDSLNIRTFTGMRDCLILCLIGFSGCRLHTLRFFKYKNWVMLMDKGFTYIVPDDSTVVDASVVYTALEGSLLTVPKGFCDKFQNNSGAWKIFEDYPDVCLLRAEDGRSLNHRYITMHINKILNKNTCSNIVITSDKIRNVCYREKF